MRLVAWLLLLSSALESGTVCFGQTFGTFTGEVKDSSGAAIQGASVMLTEGATNAQRAQRTNADGLYAFPSLPPEGTPCK